MLKVAHKIVAKCTWKTRCHYSETDPTTYFVRVIGTGDEFEECGERIVGRHRDFPDRSARWSQIPQS